MLNIRQGRQYGNVGITGVDVGITGVDGKESRIQQVVCRQTDMK